MHAVAWRLAVTQRTAPRLETFANPAPRRDYVIQHVAPEFTSCCPITGQPDFGTVTIDYVPARLCVELKSLKLYLQKYRNEGVFYEAVTNRILDDLVAAVKPRWMQVQTEWTPRGGLHSTITATYGKRRPRTAG
jgi:7-cyano-7-deazaguanine reductase